VSEEPGSRRPSATPRIEFRLWRPDDFPLAIGLWGDPRVTVFIGGPFDEAWVRRRLEEEIAFQRQHGVQYWPVFLRATGEHLGCCGLRPRNLAEGVYEVGFHLRPQHWGQGLASEAAAQALEHAFDVVGAEAVFAGHHPENSASRRTVKKLGLRQTHEELYPPTGRLHLAYLLTREEYRKERGHPG
jgi:RimJ/RimL family protein N-acetyltransferase